MDINVRVQKISNGFVISTNADNVLGYDMSGENARHFSSEGEMKAAVGEMIAERIAQAEKHQAEQMAAYEAEQRQFNAAKMVDPHMRRVNVAGY